MDIAQTATQSGIAAAAIKTDRPFFIDNKPLLEFVTDAAFAAKAEAEAAAGGELRGGAVKVVA